MKMNDSSKMATNNVFKISRSLCIGFRDKRGRYLLRPKILSPHQPFRTRQATLAAKQQIITIRNSYRRGRQKILRNETSICRRSSKFTKLSQRSNKMLTRSEFTSTSLKRGFIWERKVARSKYRASMTNWSRTWEIMTSVVWLKWEPALKVH